MGYELEDFRKIGLEPISTSEFRENLGDHLGLMYWGSEPNSRLVTAVSHHRRITGVLCPLDILALANLTGQVKGVEFAEVDRATLDALSVRKISVADFRLDIGEYLGQARLLDVENADAYSGLTKNGKLRALFIPPKSGLELFEAYREKDQLSP